MSYYQGTDSTAGQDRQAKQRKLNYSTKLFEGVPIIVKGMTAKLVTNDNNLPQMASTVSQMMYAASQSGR